MTSSLQLSFRITLLYHLYILSVHSKGDFYKHASLTTSNSSYAGATISAYTKHNGDSDATISDDQWHIQPSNDYSYFALSLLLQHDHKWSFHSNVPSFLRFTIYGNSQSNDESSLLLLFTNDPNPDTYFSAVIPVNASFNNKMAPRCSVEEDQLPDLAHGDRAAEVNQEWLPSNNKTRTAKAGFDVINYQHSYYDWQPAANGVNFPLQFIIANYPNIPQSVVSFITPTYTQTCHFSEAFPSETSLRIWLSADLKNQLLSFDQFDIEYWYNYTLNPTSAPSMAPTPSPAPAPTVSPTKGLVAIRGRWYDDLEIIDQEPASYTESLYAQGWVIFNGGDSSGYFDETSTRYAKTRYHLTADDTALNLDQDTQLSKKKVNLLTTTEDGSTWLGPFQHRMLRDNRGGDFIHIFRDFYCADAGLEAYVLTIRYTVMWCRPNSDEFEQKLMVYRMPWDDSTPVLDINQGVWRNGPEVASSFSSQLSCADNDNRNVKTFETRYPALMPPYIKFRVYLRWKMKDNEQWGQHKDLNIQCRGPTDSPTMDPTSNPTYDPSAAPSFPPSLSPSLSPSSAPSLNPTIAPTIAPSVAPSYSPTIAPTLAPSLAPSMAPSISPTQPPTKAPSYSPSVAPSLAPTYSPLTCLDYAQTYGDEYPPIDGIDYVVNVSDSIASTEIELGPKYTAKAALNVAETVEEIMVCDNPDGCLYECLNIVACFASTFDCRSSTGCNIKCESNLACGEITIYANTNANISTDKSTSDTKLSTKVHIECYKEACQRSNIHISQVTSAHIHCHEEYACQDLTIYFDKISTLRNNDTSVTCYTKGACTNLHIIADGELTRLHMYAHSEGVVLDNSYGWAFDENTITCDLHSKFIQYEFNTTDTNALDALIRAEYIDNRLPCDDVRIYCVNTDADGTPFNGTCVMKYMYHAIDQFNILPHTYSAFAPEHCVYIALYDMVNIVCEGNCQGSPTQAPTMTPSASPTQPPTISPSHAPSFSPSVSPSQPPTFSPSFSPTMAPSAAPSNNPSSVPTFPPSAAPSSAPSYSPTVAPTDSPTNAPTRDPTLAGDLYDGHTSLVYRFVNISIADCNRVYNYTQTGAIDKMQEIIEQHYFHEHLLPKFKYFQIRIVKINGVDFKKQHDEFTLDLLYNNQNGHTDIRELHARSVIDYVWQYRQHFIDRSHDHTFWNVTSTSFRQYFGNKYLNFTVANATSLEAKQDANGHNVDYAFWSLNALLALCVLIGIAAKLHSDAHGRKCGKPVDNARWFAIMFYGLQIYDVVSDINLTTEIFNAIFNREGDKEDHPFAVDGNKPNDDLTKFDTVQEYALLVSGFLSALFLVVPYFLNIAYASKIPNHAIIQKNNSARTWFEQYQSLFISLVVFSGGCYPALLLCSSRLFGFSLLNSGLSSFELTALSDIRIVTTVLTENGPQLVVQILYSWAINTVSLNTGLAFWTSIISIAASILKYCINKDKEGAVYDVYYYYELKLKSKDSRVNKEQKDYIKKRKGIKLALTKKIVKIYGDIEIANFEVGYVTIRKDNFVIRIIQHLHEEDINDKTGAMQRAMKITNITKREEATSKLFKAHCHDLFLSNRNEIKRIIFDHYGELQRSKWNFRYCKEYPKERTAAKVLHSKDRGKNLRDLIRQNTRKLSEADRVLSGSSGFDSLDLDNMVLDMRSWSYDDDGAVTSRKKRKKKKKKNIGGEVELLINHRSQIRAAFKMICDEVKRLKSTSNASIGTAQINEFISMLKAEDIHILVIEDVLHFATESGLFESEEENESDIDREVMYDSEGNEISDDAADQTQLIRRKNINISKLIEAQPSWFVTKGDKIPKKKIKIEQHPKWFNYSTNYKNKKGEIVEEEEENEKEGRTTTKIEAFPSWFSNNNHNNNKKKKDYVKLKGKKRKKKKKEHYYEYEADIDREQGENDIF